MHLRLTAYLSSFMEGHGPAEDLLARLVNLMYYDGCNLWWTHPGKETKCCARFAQFAIKIASI